MAFTYSGDPAHSEADYIRFALGDTNSTNPILTDAEIAYIVSSTASKSTAYRLSVAFRAAATALGARLVKKSLGPQSEDATKRQAYYVEQADKYEKHSAFTGTPPLPVYSADLVFDKNMMENV
jgi:hypothetical protein